MGERGKPKRELYGDEATRLYVEEGLSLSQVAARLQISEKTLRAWREFFAWDKARRQQRASKASAIDQLEKKLVELSLELETAKGDELGRKADVLAKINAVLDRLDRSRDRYREFIAVLQEFVSWLTPENEEEKAALSFIAAYATRFVEEVVLRKES